jgi:hypothetical protein
MFFPTSINQPQEELAILKIDEPITPVDEKIGMQ